MTNYSYTFINVDLNADGVAVCTMNRPDSLNAINAQGHHELEDLFAQLQRDPAVKGMGGFTEGQPGGIFDSGARALAGNLVAIEKPVIAAVNGAAVGLGATIALLCDVVFMADTARIGDPHVKVGLVPGDGGAVIWPLLVGPARAKEYLMTGDLLDAATAERIGLVNHVVSAGELMDEALTFATRLAKGPNLAIRFAKISVQRAIQQAMLSQLDLGLALEAITGRSHDHTEATQAFSEKRDPQFEGR